MVAGSAARLLRCGVRAGACPARWPKWRPRRLEERLERERLEREQAEERDRLAREVRERRAACEREARQRAAAEEAAQRARQEEEQARRAEGARLAAELVEAKRQLATVLKARGFAKGMAVPEQNCMKISYPLHVAVEENSAEMVAALLRTRQRARQRRTPRVHLLHLLHHHHHHDEALGAVDELAQ